MKTFVFAIYLNVNDLIEIKVMAEDYGHAVSKIKSILHNHVDIEVTGLYLNDEY